MQICEQKNEKKNGKAIEFSVFFSDTSYAIKTTKKIPFFEGKTVKKNLQNYVYDMEKPIKWAWFITEITCNI